MLSLKPVFVVSIYVAATILGFGGTLRTCKGGDHRTCVCELTDNSGTIDLNGLKNESNTGKDYWFEEPDPEMLFYYYYNPCVPFDFCWLETPNVSLAQLPGDPGQRCLDIGTYNSSKFSRDEDGTVILEYSSADRKRSGTVYLICDRKMNVTKFKPLIVGPWGDEFYVNFTLTGNGTCAMLGDDASKEQSTTIGAEAFATSKPDTDTFATTGRIADMFTTTDDAELHEDFTTAVAGANKITTNGGGRIHNMENCVMILICLSAIVAANLPNGTKWVACEVAKKELPRSAVDEETQTSRNRKRTVQKASYDMQRSNG